MCVTTTIELETRVRCYYEDGMSFRSIQKKLRSSGHKVSLGFIYNVINNIGKRREARSQGVQYKQTRIRTKRTPEVLKRVRENFTKTNPPTQTVMSQRLGISRHCLQDCLNDLQLKRTKKMKVFTVTDKQKANRKKNSWKLYREQLAGKKHEFVVTVDEAWFTLNEANSGSEFHYKKKGENPSSKWILQRKEVMPSKIMVVTGITARGPLKLRIVPEKVKINTDYYIKHVMKKMIEEELLEMFADDIDKVFIHHDKAPSHTSKKMTEFADQMNDKYGITFIRKEDIPVKGADISPMDFSGFGYLKQAVKRSRVKTLSGLGKKLKEIWSKVTVEQCQNTFRSWKRRCVKVQRQNGAHIEHIQGIHSHKHNK